MVDIFGQGDYQVRFDWGLAGAIAVSSDITVVVDVLSFSTSVTIAVDRGMTVLPYRWNDNTAESFAESQGATLAVGRLEAAKAGSCLPSLSPASLLTCDPVERLVLPSPNGSTIAHELASRSTVILGCFRNADAVAAHVETELPGGVTVGVIAAGERWNHESSFRPALEDLLGAGAILTALAARVGIDGFSPEASAAAETFHATRDLKDRLVACVSGRELGDKGFSADVAAALDINSATAVPVLRDGAFRGAI